MVERRPARLSPNLTRIEPASTPSPPQQSNNGGCLAAALVIGLLIIIVKCSSTTGGSDPAATAAQEVGNAQQALASAISEQAPPPPQKLSPAAIRRGAARVTLAATEGLAGEMIYSQNCYDVVGRKFSWRKLDECGGFDIEASLALGDDEPAGAEGEVAWFDSEAAAGRYLKAATAAGLDADAADRRLADMQARIAAKHKPGTEALPSAAPPEDGNKPVAPIGDEGNEQAPA